MFSRGLLSLSVDAPVLDAAANEAICTVFWTDSNYAQVYPTAHPVGTRVSHPSDSCACQMQMTGYSPGIKKESEGEVDVTHSVGESHPPMTNGVVT